jgi:hypothetical protein
VFDDEMIADGIERIFIPANNVGFGQSFVEFEVENFEAQALRCADLAGVARESRGVVSGRGDY